MTPNERDAFQEQVTPGFLVGSSRYPQRQFFRLPSGPWFALQSGSARFVGGLRIHIVCVRVSAFFCCNMLIMRGFSRVQLVRGVDELAGIPLFSGWDNAALNAIISINAAISRRSGEPLIVAGEQASAAYLILDGSARLTTPSGQFSGEAFGPGTLLAEMAMFSPIRWDHGVVAESDLHAIELSRERTLGLLRLYPMLAGDLAAKIHQRLSGVEDRLQWLGRTLDESIAVSDQPDRIEPEPAHDRRASPSRGPHPQHSSIEMPVPAQGSPIHGQAAGPDSKVASPVHGNSTK